MCLELLSLLYVMRSRLGCLGLGMPLGHRRPGREGREGIISQPQVRLHRTAEPRGNLNSATVIVLMFCSAGPSTSVGVFVARQRQGGMMDFLCVHCLLTNDITVAPEYDGLIVVVRSWFLR